MELVELKANKRTETGNGPARRLRQAGRMPAVLYGPGSEPIMLSLDRRELELVLKKNRVSQVVLALAVEEFSDRKTAMIKELQIDPLSGGYIHADFYEVAMDRKVLVKVPVVTKGKCIGVELGGMLQVIRRKLEVLCFPNRIPKSIDIDVTNLGLGDAVHVEDIVLEGGIEIPHDVNFTVLTVLGRKAEKAAGEEGEAAEEGAGAAKQAE